MRCPALPDSSENSGPAREKRSSASPASPTLPIHAGSVPRAGAHVARQRGAGIGLEPREKRVEIAPMDAFGGELRFAVGERRERAIAECRDEREDRERDQELDQREAGAPVASSRLGRLAEESRQPGEHVVGLARHRRRRSRSCETPDWACPTRSRARRTSRSPARRSPSRSAGRGPRRFELRRGEPVLRDPQARACAASAASPHRRIARRRASRRSARPRGRRARRVFRLG